MGQYTVVCSQKSRPAQLPIPYLSSPEIRMYGSNCLAWFQTIQPAWFYNGITSLCMVESVPTSLKNGRLVFGPLPDPPTQEPPDIPRCFCILYLEGSDFRIPLYVPILATGYFCTWTFRIFPTLLGKFISDSLWYTPV